VSKEVEVTSQYRLVFTARADVMEHHPSFGFGPANAISEDDVLLFADSVPEAVAKRRTKAETALIDGESSIEGALDTAIVAQVTAALLANPPAKLTVVEVTNEQGVVTLKGQVDSLETRKMAQEIAAHYPGVSTVINALEVESI
jgi:osmotically-inducible protein OsmY